MGEEVEKLSGKLGIDTTDFKTALGAANRELRVLESSFKASAASLGDWTKDATGLESRVKTLTSQIDIQKLKVNALSAEHKRLVEANGANSRAAQDAEIKLNKETETLNRMARELGTTEATLAELTDEEKAAGEAAQQMGKDVKEGSNRIDTLKSVASGAIGTLKVLTATVLAVGAVALGAIGGVSALTLKYAEQADALDDLSLKTNISKERLQELEFVGGILGTDLSTIASSQSKLTRAMSEATDGTGRQAQAFDTLGVSITNADGSLRSTSQVFGDALDALGRVENQAERDALAMDLFGKSAAELNPLIKAGSAEMQRLTEQAHDMGAVVSTETLDAYAQLNDTLFAVKAGFKGVTTELLSAFLPGFQGVFDQAGGYLREFKDIVTGSGGDFGKVAEGLTGLVSRIASDLAGQAPALLESGLAIVKSIGEAIIKALPQMLQAAVSILQTLIGFIAQNLPTLISTGVEILLTLVDTLIDNLPMLIGAALLAVIALANGLADALPTLIPAIVEAVILIVQTLIDNLPLLIEAATALILGLAKGLIIALPILVAAIPTLIDSLVDALLVSLPQFATAAGQLVGMLVYGILANLPLIVTGIGQLIATLLKTLANLPKLVVEVGKGIVMGIIEGLTTAQGLLYDAVTNIATSALDAIKATLGIASPSRKGKAIGRNLIGSTVLGAMEVMGDVERAFAGMTGRLALAAAGGIASGGAVISNSTSNRVDVFGNVIISGETQTGSLADDLTRPRY